MIWSSHFAGIPDHVCETYGPFSNTYILCIVLKEIYDSTGLSYGEGERHFARDTPLNHVIANVSISLAGNFFVPNGIML